MTVASWVDDGPHSHGKVLTAFLQGRPDDAVEHLRHWSAADLYVLSQAAEVMGHEARCLMRGKEATHGQ
jgi:hypothetical protein